MKVTVKINKLEIFFIIQAWIKNKLNKKLCYLKTHELLDFHV